MEVLLYVLLGFFVLFLSSLTRVGREFRQWMMAKMYDKALEKYESHVSERKRRLLAELSGTVLEIGPGNGVNVQYAPEQIDKWICIEPNPHMHAKLRDAGAACAVATEFRIVSAEGMSVDDSSVDTVLSTLVLCSVPDPVAVLRDIRRILKPGGRFVFLEHVAAPRGTGLRRIQRLLKPFWMYFAGGCQLDRDLGDTIRDAGFREVRMDEFGVPRKAAPAVISRQVAGVAVN